MFFFRLGKKVYGKDEGQNRKSGSSKKVQSVQEKGTGSTDVVFGRNARPSSPRETGFKERVSYEVLLEWDLSKIKRPFKYQRIGMKSWIEFPEAIQDITKFVSLMNRVSSDGATKGDTVVRIVGIYEQDAFKDWSKDTYNLLDKQSMKQHIQDAIALGKKASKGKKQKPISYVKEEKTLTVR